MRCEAMSYDGQFIRATFASDSDSSLITVALSRADADITAARLQGMIKMTEPRKEVKE